MFCIKCGKELADDVKFCQYCGQQVGEAVKNDNQQVVYVQPVIEKKSQFLAIVLCVFLGLAGFHDFYMEKMGRGLAKFLILILLGWVIIGIIINFIWCVMDFLIIINKADRCFYTKEELENKNL